MLTQSLNLLKWLLNLNMGPHESFSELFIAPRTLTKCVRLGNSKLMG